MQKDLSKNNNKSRIAHPESRYNREKNRVVDCFPMRTMARMDNRKGVGVNKSSRARILRK
jgi:hypothetical protein